MRRTTTTWIGMVSVATAVAACANTASDAVLLGLVCEDGTTDCFAGTGGTGGTTTSTTIEPGCVPSQATDPVRDDCGLFVSSSQGDDATGDGSKDKPYATIAKALGSPEGGPVYLCAETFGEAVRIKSGKTIYGGLDCSNGWLYGAAKKSEISPEAGKVPLVVDPQVGVVIEDVRLHAKDAAEPGGSSIAVIASTDAEVELTRCAVEAGSGRDGAAGEAFAMSAAAGVMGNSGIDACSAAANLGGLSVTNACDEADPNDDSIGGSGGVGESMLGANGNPGFPLGTANGGNGEIAMACTAGGPGDVGVAGTSGAGAQGMGTISAQGYAGPAGSPGEKGKPGQGGGGGGGAKGGSGAMKCADMTMAGGASGASGGSGGCGGMGGNGGQAGGASIGIVSIGASFLLTEVTITTKNGGKGGDGGAGQLGGDGGDGGMGGSKGAASALKDGCAGGKGGAGGAGGKGGGGKGGPSIGIAHTGAAPDTTGATITTGAAGDGGLGDGDMGTGAAGVAVQVQGY